MLLTSAPAPPAPCPRCRASLDPFERAGRSLRLCSGCGGMWFEPGTLEPTLGGELPVVAPERPGAKTQPCPSCPSRLVERSLPAAGDLRIDVCRGCAGVFLDRRELATLERVASARRLREERRSGHLPLAGDPSGGVADLRARLASHLPEGHAGSRRGVIRRASLTGSLFLFVTDFHLKEEGPTHTRPAYATFGLVGACLLVWAGIVLGDLSVDAWAEAAGSVPARLRAGDGLSRMLTSIFVHGGWAHLVGNLWFLWLLGEDVEQRIGPWGLLALFLGTSFGGDLFDAFASTGADATVPRVGASGGVSGLAGAYLLLYPRTRFLVPIFRLFHELWLLALPAWVVLAGLLLVNVLGALSGEPLVAWWAHVGGFGVGIAAGSVARAVPVAGRSTGQSRRSRRGARPVQRR